MPFIETRIYGNFRLDIRSFVRNQLFWQITLRFWFILAALFGSVALFGFQTNNKDYIGIGDDFTSENITKKVSVYQSKVPKSIDSISPTEFKEVNSSLLNFQFSDDEFWVMFSLKNESQTPREVIVQARNWFLDVADLYTRTDENQYTLQRAGDLVPMAEKEIRSKYPSFAVEFGPNERKLFYLRLKNTNYNQLDIFVMDSKSFFRSLETGSSWELVVGLILMRVAFHIALLFLVFEDPRIRSFNMFGIYLCAVFYFASGYGGFSFPDSPYWTNKAFYIILSLAPAVICYYVFTIYRLGVHLPRIKYLYFAVSSVGGLNIIYNLIDQSAFVSWLYICFMFGFVFLSFLSLFFFYKKFEKPSFWYLFNVGLYLPAFSYMYSRNAGLIQSPYDFNVIQFVFIIDFLTIGFILAGMFRLSQREIVQLTTEVVVKQEQALALKELNKAKSSIFTNITHELRTPLTLILSPLNELKEKLPEHQELSLMSKNANRLLDIVNQMLEVAKLDAGMMVRNDKFGDINHFFEGLKDRFSPMANEKTLTLQLKLLDPNISAHFDHDLFDKVFANLLSNAIKFTPEKGVVSLELGYVESEEIIVHIKDTGIGIHDSEQDRIFERFYQGNSSGATVQQGTGIGLSLVKEIVQFLGGSIQLESEINEGTQITVKLPLSTSQMSQPIPILVEPASSRQTEIPIDIAEEKKLLIVEDNDDLRNHLISLFNNEFEVQTAENGAVGLDLAKNWLPDIIISDIMMPVMDGIQLCKALKSDINTDHIPFIFLTAKVEEADRLLGIEIGAMAYVTKPFSKSELLSTIFNIQHFKAKILSTIRHEIKTSNISTSEVDPLDLHRPTNVSAELISPKDLSIMKLIIDYIDQNYAESSLDLEQLCDVSGLKKTTLIHKFKTHQGNTPIQYIKQLRLEKAKEILQKDPDMPIKDLAYLVGFNSPKYFSTAFGEYFGYSPSKSE